MNNAVPQHMAELLRQTAVHFETQGVDGAESDWPLGYAEILKEPFAERFGLDFSTSGLINCLLKADTEYEARASDRDWADFYADYIVECHAASESPNEDSLALYYFASCPFCRLVLTALKGLDVDVELRNIHETDQYREELVAARGRATVPVLRIESPDGSVRWMPESRDIVRYLETTYG
jgi:glutaredoxin